MDSEASCRSTAASEDEVERCEDDGERFDDDCCCCSSIHCPPHLFTSILLGLLACVLVTGGVFLAFHKWDHTWLLVSAVGVILMIIGTALHCCSASPRKKKSHRCKGGCGSAVGRNSKPDALSNGGMLSEQLLPLSNARSVSQLSLNMVPGYFPPLVYPSASTPYGLEQHSSVVQNISRLVQHQQQLHLQTPTTSADGARSFILLPLPADANAANLQNLVNAVCQLDANNSPENVQEPENVNVPSSSTQTEASHVTSSPAQEDNVPASAIATSTPTEGAPRSSRLLQPVLKHAEVQTCHEWRSPELKTQAQNSNRAATESPTTANDAGSTTTDFSCQAIETDFPRTENGCLVDIVARASLQSREPASNTATEPQESGNVICDTEEHSIQIDIPPTVISEPVTNENSVTESNAVLTSPADELASNSDALHSSNAVVLDASDDVPVDVSCSVLEDSNPGSCTESQESRSQETGETTDSSEQAASVSDAPSLEAAGRNATPEEPSESSSDFEEDSELLDRSSPPPSYEDVTQEGQSSPALGALGLAYGTM